MTKLFRSKFLACYIFAASVWIFSAFRNLHFERAIEDQPSYELEGPLLWISEVVSILMYFAGVILVVTSSWALGVLGTYNGDYFRILMEERITQFPFSVVPNPMYTGSTLIFLAHALWKQSPAGLLLSAWVMIMYQIGLLFEEPFTAFIYSQAAEERKLQEIEEKESESRNLESESQVDIRHVQEWTVDEVVAWLETKVNLPQYVNQFRQNHVSGLVLPRLDMIMLREDLKIQSLGHRFQILDDIKKELIYSNYRKKAQNKWISERRAIEEKIREAVADTVTQILGERINQTLLSKFFNNKVDREPKSPSPETSKKNL